MPNIWAHIQFGREALACAEIGDQLADERWKTAFQLGCQGPDFLFYHRFLPWQGETPLNRLGSLMHNVRCGPFLLSLFEEAGKQPVAHPAAAYTLGFALHYVLDRHLHPFVFSRSGFRKWHHQRFETAMDSAIMLRRAGLHTGKVPVAREIDTDGRLPGDFAAGFLRAAAAHYPVPAKQITPGQIDEAVAHMIKAQRLFFDPTGWKNRLLPGQLAPFSPPRRLPDWDVLNDKRQIWIDPCDRTLRHRDSAEELWARALADAQAVVPAAASWLQSGGDASRRDSLAELIGDFSYETGRECGSAWITYAESVVPG